MKFHIFFLLLLGKAILPSEGNSQLFLDNLCTTEYSVTGHRHYLLLTHSWSLALFGVCYSA